MKTSSKVLETIGRKSALKSMGETACFIFHQDKPPVGLKAFSKKTK